MKKRRIIFYSLIPLLCITTSCNNKVKEYDVNELGSGDNVQVVIPHEVEVVPPTLEDDFIPDIIDTDPNKEVGSNIDISKKYDYSNAVLTIANGSFNIDTSSEGDVIYTANSGNSLSVNMSEDTPFPYGTISADVMNNGSDTGVVFGLSSIYSSFWEGNNVSYYFFFVSIDGYAYLGRAHNGGWVVCGTPSIPGYNAKNVYNLKVHFKGNKILAYVNDELMIAYSMPDEVIGTGWGIRAGAKGATISNVKISNDFE